MMMIRTDRLPNTTTLGQKRIFLIASRPVTEGEKTIRHIVIFDNHPASLRLLYLILLRKPKSLVLLVHPLFRPRWVDAIDRGLMRLWLRFGGTTEKAARSMPTANNKRPHGKFAKEL
jgi:hypothetical protein